MSKRKLVLRNTFEFENTERSLRGLLPNGDGGGVRYASQSHPPPCPPLFTPLNGSYNTITIHEIDYCVCNVTRMPIKLVTTHLIQVVTIYVQYNTVQGKACIFIIRMIQDPNDRGSNIDVFVCSADACL